MLFLDFSTDYQLFFQDSASPMMNGIVDLHHYVMMFLFFILTFVLTMLLVIFNLFVFKNTVRKLTHKHFNHNRDIESRLLRMPLVRHTVLNMHKKRISRNSTDISLYRVLANMNYFNNIKDELNYRAAGTKLASLVLPGFKNILLINNLNNKFNCLISLNSKNVNEQNYNFLKNISTKVDFSKYITFFYLNSNDFSVRLPKATLNKAQSQIKSASWESLAVTSVFPSYILNLYYWMQTYYTLKSGIYNFTHSTVIEIVWTVLPSLVLVFIGVPSFILLYAMDEIIEPDLVIKCIGHQWYWSYETGLNIFDVPEYARDSNNCYTRQYENIARRTADYEYENVEQKISEFMVYFDIINLMSLEAEEHGVHMNSKDVLFDFDNSINVFTNLVSDENFDLSNYVSNNYNKFNHRDLSLEPLKDLLPILDNYPNFLNKAPYISFDSYMVDEKDLELGTPRLLEVDNPLVLPVQTHIDLLVTSNDVIHCWTVPSFGIKMDAVPGRLNHANVFIERTGVFYGQCSEICGPNHGFMPIKVVAVDSNSYDNYLSKFLTYEILGNLPTLINRSAFDFPGYFEPNITQYPEDAVDFAERDKAVLKFFRGEDGDSNFNIATIKFLADTVDFQTFKILLYILSTILEKELEEPEGVN